MDIKTVFIRIKNKKNIYYSISKQTAMFTNYNKYITIIDFILLNNNIITVIPPQ